ncbi:Alcohol dehydrogenase, zinc-containing [Frankia canadensis]|uniref:Alcohol dehydrogenase, zinc-containing n=1 Tax=Frankia canadensis TaxID=1836972 RepID=A0A2I2KRD1_9ACTN|nr:zinc-binding dehydrogenase [Frankia canadensis]SNQ48210.1 Alcohol dehydrogenase, zinc-containing [Frankia canadensis]SOU55500.1 Alcohol dehydrogenase, zinc-containing [Frankia canadensis]
MAGRIGRSVVFTGSGDALDLREHAVPEPRSDELLLRVTHAGVCGTDLHRLSGDLPRPPAPICFGHEGVGVIVACGADVRTDRAGAPIGPGDRLYWLPPTPCGECGHCTSGGTTALCERMVWPAPYGPGTSAGFQEYAIVRRTAAFFRVPGEVSSEAVIAFGCAMPTALGGLERLGSVEGASVVIQGSGPVGLAAIVAARDAGARRVIVIGDPRPRLAAATRLGADEVLSLESTSMEDRRARVFAATDGRGADVVVEAAGHVSAFPEGIDLLAPQGRYLIMGLYSGTATVDFNPVVVNNRALTILGTLGGSTESYHRTVEIAAKYGAELGFEELVTHRFPLERTEEAIRAVARGETIKVVVNP